MARRARYELPRYWHERGFSVAEALVRTAAEVRQPPHLVALAWLLGDPRVTSVIVGARTEQQILQNQMAGDWDLDSEHRNELDRAAAADRGYPHSWISTNATPQFADVES
jgi:aryl-alcohol dehydrogenase-like predicted oxidoreductase